jgi:predicted  nucleic acid-binding Zn-ribbon protein
LSNRINIFWYENLEETRKTMENINKIDNLEREIFRLENEIKDLKKQIENNNKFLDQIFTSIS